MIQSAIMVRFRRSGPLIHAQSSGEKIIRFVALIAVFGGVCWLFWLNTENTMEHIQSRSTVWDKAEMLTKSETKALRDLGNMLEEEYGLELKVQVAPEALDFPDLDSKTIFIGVVPARREVVLELPPLALSALGQDFVDTVEGPHFAPYFDTGDWPMGLITAVTRVWEALQDAGRTPHS